MEDNIFIFESHFSFKARVMDSAYFREFQSATIKKEENLKPITRSLELDGNVISEEPGKVSHPGSSGR